ncbi:hypothetical protein PSECIP111951_00935 [Pseudoalteromonas holothuriae]|uniref:Uncharacterized protein n=1 Tax=Pseudoalteromonas holothuriae TaxID=2963714 RepID=A0A9W4QW47_9GAMM|nr:MULTISPECIES: hypothetical protein [unclassified Pseudoalteromonas]CAH9053989.1 hypothetical protein PSECIP111951_00935 [Pseudoalteromonas sp. CIP111951]CAH9055632.1 hypothetical protein PSECIP111854_01617 [Pseudoalteromonas sp. CIP111854]
MEIQCDAIRVKASLSEQNESDVDDTQAQTSNSATSAVASDGQVAQLEKSLKRYIDKQFQQFTKQKRP